MFGGVQVDDLARIRNWNDAARHFEDTKPVGKRTREANGVPLRKSRKSPDVYWLKHDPYGDSYYIGHHSTTVVVYHKDNRVSVEPYNSRTTRELISQYLYQLRDKFYMHQHHGHQALYIQSGGGSHHYVTGMFTIDLDKQYVHGLCPATVRRVHRARAREAMKPHAEHIALFKLWRGVFTADTAEHFMAERGMRNSVHTLQQCLRHADQLDDANTWVLLAAAEASASRWSKMAGVLDAVRDELYRRNDVYYYESLPYGTLHRNAQLDTSSSYSWQYSSIDV